MIKDVQRSDIGLSCALYSRAVGENGFGPIADLDAVISAAIMRKPLILPYDRLFNVDSAEFQIDVQVAQMPNGDFAGFSVCKTILENGKARESLKDYGVATELWCVAILPQLRGLGFATKLVKDALALVHKRTSGLGGMLARVTEHDGRMSRILEVQRFMRVDCFDGITTVWLHPGSDEKDQFADIPTDFGWY